MENMIVDHILISTYFLELKLLVIVNIYLFWQKIHTLIEVGLELILYSDIF